MRSCERRHKNSYFKRKLYGGYKSSLREGCRRNPGIPSGGAGASGPGHVVRQYCAAVPAPAPAQNLRPYPTRRERAERMWGCAVHEPGPPDLRAQHQQVPLSHRAKRVPCTPRDRVWVPGGGATTRRDPCPGGSMLVLARLEGKPGYAAYAQVPPLMGKTVNTLAGPCQPGHARRPRATLHSEGARKELSAAAPSLNQGLPTCALNTKRCT